MSPAPPAQVPENSYELDKNNDLVKVGGPTSSEYRPQSQISDSSETTEFRTSQNDSRPTISVHSSSSRRRFTSEPGLASVPKDEAVYLPEQVIVTVTSHTSNGKQNSLTQNIQDAIEHKDNNEADDLNITLSHPYYLQLQNDLNHARMQQKKLEDEVVERSSELAMIKSELVESNSMLADARKGWRKAASELNKIRSAGQGFYSVTDQFLIDKTSSLRYSIRNFAIQYFEGEMRKEVKIQPSRVLERYIKPTTPNSTAYRELFSSSKRCPSLVQGILWRVLYENIFDQFQWAGGVKEDMVHLSRVLKPKRNPTDFRLNPEAERKFQIWSATTIGLVVDAIDFSEGSDAYKRLETRKLNVYDDIYDAIEPFARHMDEGFQQEILKILEDAITLDKEISRQVARVTWKFPGGEFDPSKMSLNEGGRPQIGSKEVQVIVAPGLLKRGKSTGEDFKLENLLLLADVSCEPAQLPPERSPFRSKIF